MDLGTDGLPSLPGLSIPFKSYRVFVNGTWYWIRLTYEDTSPYGGPLPIRQLFAVIAWSDDVTDDSTINSVKINILNGIGDGVRLSVN